MALFKLGCAMPGDIDSQDIVISHAVQLLHEYAPA